MRTRTLHYILHFNATPAFIYNMLMDENIHSAFTGAKAKMSAKVGGSFISWDGYIKGKNIELIKDALIRQEWISSDMPSGHSSTVIFQLQANKKGGTDLTFTHENVPENIAEDIEKGWDAYYWQPMRNYIKENS